MLARLAARLFLAPLGFVCGIIVGFSALALICSKTLGVATPFPDEVVLLGYDMSVSAATLIFLLAPLMAAPAMVAVLIAEMFSIRSFVYHAAAGAVTAYLPWSLAPTGMDGPLFAASQILACGVLGGLTHWLVAGRSSGLAPPEPSSE